MLNKIKQLKIRRLKKKARKYYLQFNKIFEEMDCGMALALNISPRLVKLKNNFNNTLDELAKIDSECIIKRL